MKFNEAILTLHGREFTVDKKGIAKETGVHSSCKTVCRAAWPAGESISTDVRGGEVLLQPGGSPYLPTKEDQSATDWTVVAS